jgi:predicted phosphodiesterase
MRFAVISDIHGNLEALSAVLEEIRKFDIKMVYCLGDVIGYGADPEACLDLVQQHISVCLRGNHEEALLHPELQNKMSQPAVQVLEWTRNKFSEEKRSIIAQWPLVHTGDDARLVHASPHTPLGFEYVRSRLDCEFAFEFFPEKICFLGHSHIPFIAEEIVPGVVRWSQAVQFELDSKCRYIINVGSVGQPRNHDPRACWVMIQDQPAVVSIQFVEYNVALAQNKIRQAKFPEVLATRLNFGI